jgi:hypothetical protein
MERIMDVKKVSRKIVKDIMEELYGRGGFDSWWDDVDEETQDELMETLRDLVAEILNKA